MVTVEQLEKVIELADKSCGAGGVYVVRNDIECDTDNTSICFDEDILWFEFAEDDVTDFEYDISEIESIAFEDFANMIVVVLKITNGDTVIIHNL